jgi:hypothetical protein
MRAPLARNDGDGAAPHSAVIHRAGGGSSTPRLLDSIIDVSGILGPRLRGDDSGEYDFALSRRIAPEVCKYFRDLFKKEGAGNAGCTLHPRSRAQRGSGLRARAYRAAEAIRHSLRSGFTAYNVISPVSRSSLATVAPEKLVSPELDASIGRQDHTTSPYALAPFVIGTASVHRVPSHVSWRS